MRIIHLIKHSRHGNGHVHVAVDLACRQVERGHQVVYASAGGTYDPLLSEKGVTLAVIDQDGRSLRSLASNLLKFFRLCRETRPDVIHAHMMSSAVFGYAVSRLLRVSLVTTVHNSFDRHSILMRLGDAIVAVSEADREQLLSRGFSAKRTRVVLNGPNESPRESFVDAPSISFATPCVTTVCGLHRRKGVSDIIHAFAKLHPEFPDWHFNIIGEGPDRSDLEALAENLGIGGSVHFLGSLPHPRPFLEKSAIFVLASLAEPCSLAVAEARRAGCAIIATAVGGTPELLEHGKAGQLVEIHSPGQITALLQSLIRNEGSLREWRLRSKSGADYFSTYRVSADYDKVYEESMRFRRIEPC